MDFLSEQALLYTSKEYEQIYIHFNEKYKIKLHDLFLLFASIGAKNGKAVEFTGKGREMRTNYFNSDQRDLAYTIILNDELTGKDIDRFTDKDFFAEARKLLERYAQGGLIIIVEEVFKSRWNGVKLDEDYKDYEIDMLSYVYGSLNDVPF
ncbi:MAG: hypothetical protein KKF57_00155 [Firmicutes bacterium]|nr:hypothetical protein [Bacillota bacterium]